MTPEGYVKRELKRQLVGRADHRWPVTRGMGSLFLDCHAVVKGFTWAIECKAPGEEPTPRQHDTMLELWAAGALVSVYQYNEIVHHEDAHRVTLMLDALNGNEYFKARYIAREWLARKTYKGKPIVLDTTPGRE